MNTAALPSLLAALGGALVLIACDPKPRPETGAAVVGSPAATAPRPPAPVADASVPPAASVVDPKTGKP